MDARREVRTWVWVVAALGAAAMIVGAFLPWLDTGGLNMGGGELQFSTMAGVDTTVGMVSLVIGIVAAVLIVVAFLLRRGHRAFGLLLIIGGVGAAAAALSVLLAPEDAYVKFVAGELGVSADSLDDLPELFEQGLLSSDGQIGLYLTVVGGVLLVVAGIAALLTRRKAPVAEPVAGGQTA